MYFLKAVSLFVIALIIAVYAVVKDELLWFWASVLLVVAGVSLFFGRTRTESFA